MYSAVIVGVVVAHRRRAAGARRRHRRPYRRRPRHLRRTQRSDDLDERASTVRVVAACAATGAKVSSRSSSRPGVVLVLLAQILNVVVFTYGKGTVRTALDEAARAGARDGLAACEATADQVIGELLGGALGADVQISCSDAGRRIVATADVHFDGWLTSLADYDGTFSASAAKEDR